MREMVLISTDDRNGFIRPEIQTPRLPFAAGVLLGDEILGRFTTRLRSISGALIQIA